MASQIDQNSEGGRALQRVLQEQLKGYLGADYSDDVLPLYIVVMLAHGTTQALVAENLEARRMPAPLPILRPPPGAAALTAAPRRRSWATRRPAGLQAGAPRPPPCPPRPARRRHGAPPPAGRAQAVHAPGGARRRVRGAARGGRARAAG